ncbi:transcriptional repressor general negative regulator of transcription subunit 4 [Ceratobasidium sp. 392]|nr:transcriptional repressor general negative regulator of transcription subunit 4 [Ceratobasidium sp. 392]
MEDAELAAIRAARLNQLQQQSGSSRPSQAGGFPAGDNEGGDDGNRQSEDQMKRDLLATVLDSSARERLARISLVRPALSGQIEQILLRMAQTGQLRGRVTEQQLIGLLEQAEESQAKNVPKKVVYQRRKELDDDDFDLVIKMSSRLPRSPRVSHSTANGHSGASHAKSHVLAGVQDAYWSDDEAENLECPLCLEEMDLSDLHFKPCPCGYQICNFCWHHIKENLNGRCPACRREYTEQPAEFKSVTAEEQKRLNAQKRKRDKERKELEALNRRHFANVRIVQRNLVYVTGLGSRKHAMKDSETRQTPAAPRKRVEESEGAPTPPMGAALPRGASWGQNRGALPAATAALSSSASSAFPAISATLPSANQSSRQARSGKARGASSGTPASERPATPSRSRRSERNRDRSAKSTEAVSSSVSAVPPGLVASRPSTPGLSNPPSRPSTASKSPRDAFKSPTLATAQPISLASVEEPTTSENVMVAAGATAEAKDDSAATSAQSPPAPSPPVVPPPPPGLSLPPPPPGLVPTPQQVASTQQTGLARPAGLDHAPSHPQYQMSGAAKALLDDVRARRESAPPISTQQSPFPDFDRTLSNLSAGGFSFSFNLGSNGHARDDIAPVSYPSSAPVSQDSALPARGVSGLFDPFRKNDPTPSLPPPPGLTVAQDSPGYQQSSLSTHTDSRAAYTGAFNPFADGVGGLNRSGSYDSDRDAAERTSSRFGFARRQDSFGQSSVGYGASNTSSPNRIIEQLPPTASTYASDVSVSPQPAHWQYHHNSAAEYGPPGISQQISLGPSPLQQQIYAPPGINHPHFSDGMELNAAGLKELLNIGGNGSNARLDTRRSQTGTYIPPVIPLYDSFDARFGSQPFRDPAIMSFASQDMTGAGQNMPQNMYPHLERNSSGGLGLPQATTAAFRSPPGIPATMTSPPPGFGQPVGRTHIIRQASQTSSPAVSVHGTAMSDSPAFTTAPVINFESVSPVLSASDFPALPPPSTESQSKRETNQPFIQPRVTTADAKAAVLAAKKATGAIPKKSSGKPTSKPAAKSSTSATEDTTATLVSDPTVDAKPVSKSGSTESEYQLLETLTQTISDLLRMLPRTTWDDTSAFDGVLKDMLKAEEFLEENADDLSNCRDDDVTVLAQALEKRARWMEIQLVKLEELHRDINTAAVRSVLEQNDRGWGPRIQEPKGESLAQFEQLGYIHENGVRRTMSIQELEIALKQAKAWEAETEVALKDAMLTTY